MEHCETAFCACPPRGRRALFCSALSLGAVLALPRGAVAADPVPRSSLSPDQALALLKEGNARFVADAPFGAAVGRQRRVELAGGQAPFCVLVGCSDSRVPPELLFSRGLGELFIVRNAGNTVDTAAMGSIEYGIGVLGCPLLVVLGHERCGAVAAAVDVLQRNATFPGVIGEMIQPIIPAALAARTEGGDGADLVERAIVTNAKRVATRVRTQSPIVQGALRDGRLKIVAARYDLDDGSVTWFEDF